MLAFISLLSSQFLIITQWSDLSFITPLSIIFLIALLIVLLNFSFKRIVRNETQQMLASVNPLKDSIVSDYSIQDLPSPVQNWLHECGMMGKAKIQTVFLEQSLKLRMNPVQKDWTKASAKQYFTVSPPAFNWFLVMKMNRVLPIAGRDKFEGGKGEMTIKLFSAVPIASVKSSKKVDQASLQRYLAEVIWFPSAVLSPYLTWEAIDENSARVSMTFNGTEGSGVFHFDKAGNFVKFVAMRYKDAQSPKPIKWIATALKIEERSGIKIPTRLKVEWELGNDLWNWLEVNIGKVIYNDL